MPKVQFLALAPVLLIAACASRPVADKTAAAKEPSPHCLRETGTRLQVPEGKCAGGPGRVFTREQLERTGAITTGEALNRIAPF